MCTFFHNEKKNIGKGKRKKFMNNSSIYQVRKLSRKEKCYHKNVSVNFIITCVHCQRVNKVTRSLLWRNEEKRATVTIVKKEEEFHHRSKNVMVLLFRFGDERLVHYMTINAKGHKNCYKITK